MLWAE